MKAINFLFRAAVALLALPRIVATDDNLVPTTGRALLRFFSNQARALGQVWKGESTEVVTEPQPLLVINAGHGRTGTASFVRAMDKLGIRCYHMKEGIFETFGHMGLWSKFLVDHTVGFDAVMDAVANAGFNATADAPMNFFYKEQMKRYPNAPVISSIRTEKENAGHAWERSLRESVFRFPEIMGSVPFRWMPGLRGFKTFVAVIHNMMAGLPDGKSEEIDSDKLIRFYDDWIEEVKRTVPSEKLLIFKATDGWEPLCQHISQVSPVVAANCRKILESGEPFPKLNDRISVQRTQFFMRCITKLTYAWLASMPLFSWLLMTRFAWKRFHTKAIDSDEVSALHSIALNHVSQLVQ